MVWSDDSKLCRRAMTVEEVFTVILDLHHTCGTLHPAELRELQPETTIREFESGLDAMVDLRKWVNEVFEIDLCKDEWRQSLAPAKQPRRSCNRLTSSETQAWRPAHSLS
jgi:hypothetical protein